MKRITLPSILVWCIVSASVCILAYTFWKSEINLQGAHRELYIKYYWISVVGLCLAAMLCFLKKSASLNVALVMISGCFGLVIAEITLNFTPWVSPVERTKLHYAERAEREGISFDRRSKSEVLQELRADGVDAVPALHNYGIILELNDERKRSLSGVSGRTTVFCNESGYWSVYTSDRYGFNNPNDVWDNAEVEGLFLGDSFVHGACVGPGSDLVAQMRIISGKSFINLGVGGTGPLHQFAVMREYADIVRVRKVFWVYFERNDLSDLIEELKDRDLLWYLHEAGKRNLKDYQQEIDLELLKLIDRAETDSERKEQSGSVSPLLEALRRTMTLGNVRRVTGFNEIGRQILSDQEADKVLNVFQRTLETVKEQTVKWGGQLYFVYLPDFDRYGRLYVDHKKLFRRGEVLSVVRETGIPIIDIHQSVFAKHHDPWKLFPFGASGHYTANGYRYVAKSISESVYEH